MSIQQTQIWLQNHSDSIPAISHNHQQITNLLEHEHKSQDIVHSAAADPGLSLALLKKVNTKRGPKSGRDIVTSTKSAIALLGDRTTHALIKEFTVAENKLDNPQQLFLFRQIINRSFHNEIQVAEWARENGYQHIEQLKASALLNYAGEALSCVYDFDNYLKYVNTGSVEGEEKNYFGFSFPQLTESLCQNLNLPEIIIESQPHNNAHGQKQRFLLFIAKLCHQCEHGWYTQKQQETFQQFSDFIQQPVDLVISKFHQFSVMAAKQSVIPDAWQAASRLILIQDKAWAPPAPEKQEIKNKSTIQKSQKEPLKEDIFTRIKQLVSQQSVSQSDILNTCMNGLFKDFSMNRVCLLLLSKDKQKLKNRLSLGLEKGSPFQKYQIEVSRSGLLQMLLNKPQAIWINTSNFKKYQKIIPPSLLANIMTTDFFAMSLFIGEKPVGIIYADRSKSTNTINEKDFIQYKQLISLTSKVLTFLSNRQKAFHHEAKN